jgi:hypothetical protein
MTSTWALALTMVFITGTVVMWLYTSTRKAWLGLTGGAMVGFGFGGLFALGLRTLLS